MIAKACPESYLRISEQLLISIIIPTYNSGKTLKTALDSILTQTYKDLEIWIIDGVSTDNTINIVNSYKESDERIQYIIESDKGIYDAMNKGIQLAKGKWLYFMGSDDCLYEENVLERVFCSDNAEEYDILYGNVFSKNKTVHGEFGPEKLVKKPIPHQAMFYRTAVFHKYGGYDISCKCRADYLKTVELFFECDIRWKYINEVIAHYARGGYSDLVYDTGFDDIIEEVFLRHFSGSLDRKKIYEGMLCTVPYNLKQGSVSKALRFIWNSGKTIEYLPHIAHGLKHRYLSA